MKCSYCKQDNTEGSQFCSKCGKKIDINESDTSNKFTSWVKKSYIWILSAGVVIVLAVLVYMLVFDSVSKYEKLISANDSDNANIVYEEEIKGDKAKEKEVTIYLEKELKIIINDFKQENNTYKNAIDRLNAIEDTSLVEKERKKAILEINKINNSKTAFLTGNELLKDGDIKGALLELRKVNEDDLNYKNAQKIIEENLVKYKDSSLASAQESGNKEDYRSAIKTLNESLKVIPKDSEITSILTLYENKLEVQMEVELKKKIEEAKNNQVAKVEEVSITTQTNESDYKWIYPDMIQTLIRNESDTKTIKSLEVGILAYDENGFPMKIEPNMTSLRDPEYLFVGIADDVNTIPNGIFGYGVGWELGEYHDISQLIACVKSVTYYDGSTWNNDYYDYWVLENKEKPLE